MGVLVPVQGVVLLAWFFWQTFPGSNARRRGDRVAARLIEWLRPDRIENVGTVLAQWAVLLAVLWSANRWMGMRRTGRTRPASIRGCPVAPNISMCAIVHPTIAVAPITSARRAGLPAPTASSSCTASCG